MAWYHVGACSCPMGCCDCESSPSVKPAPIKKKTKTELLEEKLRDLKRENSILKKDLKGINRRLSILGKTFLFLIKKHPLQKSLLPLYECCDELETYSVFQTFFKKRKKK